MAFVAKGKCIEFGPVVLGRDGQYSLRAIMHEGFFGKNHVININIDAKFYQDMCKSLGHKVAEFPKDKKLVLGDKKDEFFGSKLVGNHNITIIIE